MSTIIVRAFNSEGYHCDILTFDEQQVRSHDARIADEFCFAAYNGGATRGVIYPDRFPEMKKFELIIVPDKRR